MIFLRIVLLLSIINDINNIKYFLFETSSNDIYHLIDKVYVMIK